MRRAAALEFVAAIVLLTRLPVARWLGGPPPKPRECVWAYPLAGALVGAVGAAAWLAACAVALPSLACALLALAAMALLSGGLHEDGLADVADGFGGGAGVARKLEIMRDSRVGSYGVLALMFAVGLRAAALAASPVPYALVASGALSRAALLLPALVLPPARVDGLGAGLGRPSPLRALSAGLIALGVALAVLPAPAAAEASLAATIAAAGVSALAWRQIAGTTGDVLGAASVAAETAVLLALSAG